MCIASPGVKASLLPDRARREAFAARATMGGGTPQNQPRTPAPLKAPASAFDEVGGKRADTRLTGGMKL